MKNAAGAFLQAVKRNIFYILFFMLIVFAFFRVVNGANEKSRREEKRIALESLNRAAVTCYAIEGRYPESYEYLKENYGIKVNENKFKVVYEIFAANIMPRIYLIER
jgi:hypothetical protein